MFRSIPPGAVGRWASLAAVVLVPWLVGVRAAQGMSTIQWAGGLAAIAAAIAWAVIERCWPRTADTGGAR
jgi:hypothetical protein